MTNAREGVFAGDSRNPTGAKFRQPLLCDSESCRSQHVIGTVETLQQRIDKLRSHFQRQRSGFGNQFVGLGGGNLFG